MTVPLSASAATTLIVDSLTFGDLRSEHKHHFFAEHSDTITGGLGEPARRLLPLEPQSWEGGKMSFTMKVDPARPNYFTIKLWGDDQTQNRLILFGEGKQIGYRHESDIEILDHGTEDRPYNGRFYYRTSPLPLEMTSGKTQLSFEIRSSGAIWAYGQTFEQFQKTMTEPTRGLYRVYTHTDGFFTPPANEKQGAAPTNPPTRKTPGPEVLDALKERVNTEIDKLLARPTPLNNQMHMQFLAKTYGVKWTRAYRNPQVVPGIIAGMDALFLAHRQNPKLVENEPATPNPDWFGFGPMGHAIALLSEPIKPALDEPITDEKGGPVTRRAAYAEMLRASVDYLRTHRRQYTNQSMIVDLNIAASNRGLQVVDPATALPQEKVLDFLYQSLGMKPWLGSDTESGPAKPLGENYWQLTAKGLTKEMGYVGYYGEVLPWVTLIYDITRPTPGQPGDPQIKAQLVKMALARGAFRFPTVDEQGNRAMRIETVTGWRDNQHYPGDVVYVQRPDREGSALQAAAATLDPRLIGYAQQMLADNQFFASVEQQMEEKTFRVTAGLIETPDQFALLQSQPPQQHRLPMGWDQPDFVFTDEEDGVVALKNGEEILYASLYWRATHGINNLANVHYLTPRFDRAAVVRQDSQFTPSGLSYTRPNEVNTLGVGWLPKYPGDLLSAHTGEALPIPKILEGVTFKAGDRSPFAGKADFYRLRYGPYLIGMNTTKDKTFDLGVNARGSARDLVSGKTLKLSTPIRVEPMSTVVLRLQGALTLQPFKTPPAPAASQPAR